MSAPEEFARSESRDPSESPYNARRSQGSYFANLYKRPRGLTRRQLEVLVVVIILLVLLVVDGIYVIVNLRNGLEEAADNLRAARTAIEDGNLEEADEGFEAAETGADQAAAASAHPSMIVASILPFIDRDVAGLRALTEAAGLVSTAGQTTVDAGRQLGGTTSAELAAAFYQDGRVQLETIRAGEPALTEAVALLSEAEGVLRAAPSATTDAVRDALGETIEQVTDARRSGERAATLVEALPPLVGADGPRRYLLAFQSPSEARGTGGIIGLYGILEATRGRIALTRIGRFAELFDPTQTDELATRFDDRQPTPTSINRSANFPSVAKSLLEVYKEASGTDLDGVVAADPVALGELMKGTGPVRGRGLATPIGPENAAPVLLGDYYIRFEDRPQAQIAFVTSVIRRFYASFGGSDIDAPGLIEGLGAATRSQHLKIYSVHPDEESALIELGASGSFETQPGYLQFVFHNNLARNKVDYFLERTIDSEVRLTLDGYALVTTTVTLHNDAPKVRDPLTSSLTGEVPPGVNRMSLSSVIPDRAAPGVWKIAGRTVDPSVTANGDLSRVSTTLEIPAGETKVVRFSYEISGATDPLRGGYFAMGMFPQATVRPDKYSVRFFPPPRYEVTGEGTPSEGGSMTFDGTLDRPTTFEVELRPL